MSRLLIESKEFKSWIRNGEAKFLNALQEYGDDIQRGRGMWGDPWTLKPEGPVTNRGMCDRATAALIHAAKINFGKDLEIKAFSAEVRVVTAAIEPYNIRHMFARVSTWQSRFTVDPTFGQIHSGIDRILVFPWFIEPEVYDYKRAPTPWDKAIEDRRKEHLRDDPYFPRKHYKNLIAAMM